MKSKLDNVFQICTKITDDMKLRQIWDGTKCKRIRTMGGHPTRTGVLAWSSCILASGSRDKNILQHDIRISNDFIRKLAGHRSEVCF